MNGDEQGRNIIGFPLKMVCLEVQTSMDSSHEFCSPLEGPERLLKIT